MVKSKKTSSKKNNRFSELALLLIGGFVGLCAAFLIIAVINYF